MTVRVIRGDARDLPLETGSVDVVVTSPPYFALRSYQDGGEHYAGQIGDEPTPDAFVDSLLECTREMVRVLKPTGSIFVNLGDKYAQSAAQWGGSRRGHQGVLAGTSADEASRFGVASAAGAPQMGRPKSLIGIPWRYALRCIDDLGLILRAEIIWSKPNGLPESVTDRVRRSHEQWFHFTVSPRYYSAVDEIREPHVYPNDTRHLRSSGYDAGMTASINSPLNPLGKLPGSVWSVPTEPLRVPPELGVDHFAAFPTEWPRRFILGWSPREVCSVCGEGRRPVTDNTPAVIRPSERRVAAMAAGADRTVPSGTQLLPASRTITGYACACPDTTAPATPGVVLDPFGGTGTTSHVASALGRHGITVDLSADYCRLANNRDLQTDRAAKVLRVDKPPKQLPGQADLFTELGGDAA